MRRLEAVAAALLAAVLVACGPTDADVRACSDALDARDRKTAVERARDRLDGIPRVPDECDGIDLTTLDRTRP